HHSTPPELTTFFTPLGAGFRWAAGMPGIPVGDTIVSLGPGQRCLASVIAAREARAGCIIVTGLAADERKLELARELGAHHAVNIEKDDITNLVREATDGRMADVVIDVTSYSVEAVKQAINLARRGGKAVLAGPKGPKAVPASLTDQVVLKALTILCALGVHSPQ